jgi:hypothetical protein
MRFRDYLTELHNIEVGQAMHAHEPRTDNDLSLSNPKIRAEINHRLTAELNERTYEVTSALQKIRKVLHRYFIDLPANYELDPDGDEVFFEVEQFGQSFGSEPDENKEYFYLYLLYFLEDDGYYAFDVELVNEDELAEILDESGVTNFDDDEQEDDTKEK